MKIRAAVPALAALIFALTPFVWAQASTAPAPAKIGVINIQMAIASTAEGKQAGAELQSQFASRANELQDMQKQIDDVRARLQNGQTTLGDEEKARLTRQGEQLTRTFQRKQQELQDDSNDAQQDVVNRIGAKMMDVLTKYSNENGYAVILDTSSQQTPVIYATNQVDVTQDIIRLYDQANPVKTASGAAPKSATPAPKPAAPKP